MPAKKAKPAKSTALTKLLHPNRDRSLNMKSRQLVFSTSDIPLNDNEVYIQTWWQLHVAAHEITAAAERGGKVALGRLAQILERNLKGRKFPIIGVEATRRAQTPVIIVVTQKARYVATRSDLEIPPKQ